MAQLISNMKLSACAYDWSKFPNRLHTGARINVVLLSLHACLLTHLLTCSTASIVQLLLTCCSAVAQLFQLLLSRYSTTAHFFTWLLNWKGRNSCSIMRSVTMMMTMMVIIFQSCS